MFRLVGVDLVPLSQHNVAALLTELNGRGYFGRRFAFVGIYTTVDPFYQAPRPRCLGVGVSSIPRDIIFRVQQKPVSLGQAVSTATAAEDSTFILAPNSALYY